MNKGLLIVISGPSGCGKGTVLKKVFNNNPNIKYSISATTRAMRDGEIDGVNYHYLTQEKFDDLVAKNGFLEYARYVGNSYGTPKKPIDDWLNEGFDVVLEIETIGANQIRKSCENAVFIFMLPPSEQELRNRLVGRNTETADIIEKRIKKAIDEMKFASTYDYIIINDNVDTAAQKLQSIIIAEKCKPQNSSELV